MGSTIAIVAGWLVLLLGLAVVIGWHFDNRMIIQVRPHYAPMQFNTAGMLLLSAAALLLWHLGRRRLMLAAATVTIVVAVATLLEYLLDRSFGIDELLFDHAILVKTSHPGRMAPNTALCFLLTNLSLILLAYADRHRALIVTAAYSAGGTFVLSLVALIGYFQDYEAAYGWGETTRMAVHAAAGFVALAVGLLAAAFSLRRNAPSRKPLETALFVGAMITMFSLMFWQAISSDGPASFWIVVVLLFDLLIAGLITLLIYLSLTRQRRQRWLEVENKRRRRTERLAESRNTTLKAILENISEGVVVVDKAGELILFNEAARNILPKRAFELRPDQWAEQLDFRSAADDRQLAPHDMPLARALRGERFSQSDVKLPGKNSSPRDDRYLSFGGSPIVSDGERGAAVVTVRDVSASRRARQRLKLSEDRFHRAVQGTTDGLWDWDVGSGTVWYAPRFAELLGYQPHELPQTFEAFESRLHPDDHDHTMQALDQHLREDAPYDAEFRLHTRSGEYRWFRARGSSTRDAAGDPVRTAGSIQDIHELKLFELAIHQRTTELARANEELEQFNYTVSHDLKSPLVTISGFLGMLERDLEREDREAALQRMQRIRAASDRMRQLLDELLELSRVGRVMNPAKEVSLKEIAHEVTDLCAMAIHTHGVNVEIDEALPAVLGDRTRLREVLQNLLENAIKFSTDRSTPKVEIGVRPTGETHGSTVTIFVRDNGRGLDPAYAEQVFRLFEQVDRNVLGTGIGLTLVKRIVEVHGGEVWMESDGENQGCTVCFTLPTPVSQRSHFEEEGDLMNA